MNTSVDKITAGIAARTETPSDLPKVSLANLANSPKTLSELIEFASRADIIAGAFSKHVAALKGDLQKGREAIDAQLEQLRQSGLPEKQRREIATKLLNDKRKEILANSDEHRWKRLSDLRELESAVVRVESLYRSSVSMLVAEAMESDEYAKYRDRLARLTPQEVTNMAVRAVATGNRVLGAAVMDKLTAMKGDARFAGVTRQEVAEALAGDDFRRAQEAFAIVRNRMHSAIRLNRELESNKVSGLSLIQEGLAQRNESGALAAEQE